MSQGAPDPSRPARAATSSQSSLDTPSAQRLRARTSQEVIDRILAAREEHPDWEQPGARVVSGDELCGGLTLAAVAADRLGLQEPPTVGWHDRVGTPHPGPPQHGTAIQECLDCGTASYERANYCRQCGAGLGAPGLVRTSKTATIVSCDLVDSTALCERLGPEAVHRVLSRLYAMVHEVFERYGGTIAHFRGDGAMISFGVPRTHEDDALRAVTAAAELRDALAVFNQEQAVADGSLRLRMRIGINTGEVVVGVTDSTKLLGATANIAAGLERMAQPDEILIDDRTWRLARDAVMVEGIPPLTFKDKANPVPAYRLVEVLPDGSERSPEVPLVGRRQELELLRVAYERVVRNQSLHLVTVLGLAGTGKTRLVDELVGQLGEQATVLRGRCLPYGKGVITYYPIVQALRQAAGVAETDDPATTLARVEALVAGHHAAARIAKRVAQVLGVREGSGPWEDTFWALRSLFELLARRRPLVLVIDDLHAAEPTLLGLIEHLADWSLDAPILLVCLARTELLDLRPGWAGGKRNATCMQLPALTTAEAGRLVTHLLGQQDAPAETVARIVRAAEGNPLFVGELVAVLRDGDPQTLPYPEPARLATPRMESVLEVRLDRLRAEERRVIECAAVIGQRFFTPAITELLPGWSTATVRGHLASLVRKQLVRPDSTAVLVPSPGAGTYRFQQGLLRDVAYRHIPKEVRANLHKHYADWLERVVGERAVQFNEIIAYHLELAYRYQRETGSATGAEPTLARRAGLSLAMAGHLAMCRGDIPATMSLLERALKLLDDNDEVRLQALSDLANALRWQGKFGRAQRVYDAAIGTARAMRDETRALHAHLGRLGVLWYTDPQAVLERGRAEVALAMEVFKRRGDKLGLAKAWRRLGEIDSTAGDSRAALDAVERALAFARQAGDERWESRIMILRCLVLYWGPAPLDEVAAYAAKADSWAQNRGVRRLQATTLIVLGRVRAMHGEFDEARALLKQSARILESLGERRMIAMQATSEGVVELLAGEFETAGWVLRSGSERLAEMGADGPRAALLALLARALLEQKRYEDAGAALDQFAAVAAAGDVELQAKGLGARAVLLARMGRPDEALRDAEEAVAHAECSDKTHTQAVAYSDLATVLRLAGQRDNAVTATKEALRRYEAKGDRVSARLARTYLP